MIQTVFVKVADVWRQLKNDCLRSGNNVLFDMVQKQANLSLTVDI